MATAPLRPEDQLALDAWLSGDASRKTLLDAHNELIASVPLRLAMIGFRTAERRKADSRWPDPRSWAIASAAFAGLTAMALWPRPTLEFKTPQGRQYAQVLSDGSKLTLNGDSRARVALASRERDVRLDRGEAFFRVAHDPSRPFTVHARDASVTALGTAFNVNRLDDATEISVHEGKVRVVAIAARNHPVVVSAGESIRVSARGIEARSRFNPAIVNDWRSGWIELNNGRLGDLVTELNRANAARPIELKDPSLANLRLTGRFRANAPRETAALVAATHRLDLREAPGAMVLYSRP